MRIVEPVQFGQRFFHYPQAPSDLGLTLARCISCRRPKPFSEFGGTTHWGKPMQMAVCYQCRGVQGQLTRACQHPLYNPELGLFFDRLYGRLLAGAAKRRIPVLISKEDIIFRYFKNECRCELTGVMLRPPIAKRRQSHGDGMKNHLTPSVDRINSGGCYSADNIQIVAAIVNIMKNDLSSDEFLMWCKRVVSCAVDRSDDFAAEFEQFEQAEKATGTIPRS